MRLSDLEKYDPITIQCHDNPDADTVGAGYGLYRYFADKGHHVKLIYSGHNRIKKTNLKLMIEKCNIPIKYVPVTMQEPIKGLLITVDCQYGAGNVTSFRADHVAVIDHHPLELQELEHYRVQPNMGSCSTLVWSMLQEEGYPIAGDVNLGTVLYYGLYTDTNQFSELFNPLDMDMREAVTINKRLMRKLRNSNISLKELEIAGIAMLRYNYNEDHHFALIKAQPCDPNILGLISDFLLQVDSIDVCVVYNQVNDGYKISVRSCIREVNANELAAYLTEGIGSGGGHFEKAGGFVSMKLYEDKYPTLHSEAYFNNRLEQYFDTFTIMTAEEMEPDLQQMKLYQRVKEPMCCLKTTDVANVGERISIRTKDSNIECIVSPDLYYGIEREGIIHPMNQVRFAYCMDPEGGGTVEDYLDGTDFAPTIKNCTTEKIYPLANVAKMYLPRDRFRIYAVMLDKYVKLFPQWDEEQYMLGVPGDYLVVSEDDHKNFFIEPGEHFLERYEEITVY